MVLKSVIALAAVATLAGCHGAGAPPAASIPAAPIESYTCERGTKLTVKLLGATADVGVNGAAPVSLPVLGNEGTTYTNGRMTLMIVQGKVSWAIGRMAPEACTPG